MNPITQLNDRFTGWIAQDHAALVVMFRMFADAEENGEAPVFERVAARLPPRLAGLVQRHAADELRHIGLIARALEGLGAERECRDGRADLVALVDDQLGGLLDPGPAATDAELGRAYLLLHALERRMSAQLGQIALALRAPRPELAAIVDEIARDELKHVAWCEVVAFHLLGRDAETHARVKAEMIALEARLYPRVTHQNLRAILANGLSSMPWWERLAWHAVAWSFLLLPSFPVVDRTGTIAARAWTPPAPSPA